MIKKICLCVFFHFVFSIEIYKEIKIFNEEIENISFLQSLGLDVDHMIQGTDYIQFAINEYDLNKLILNNINYEVIHHDLQTFYENRLDQNYISRDFELGSMGGYYTFDEIEYHLDQLSSLYPNIISQKISIGQTYEDRNIWAVKISDNHEIEENEQPQRVGKMVL